MNKSTFFAFLLLLLSNITFSQVIDLGTTANFVLFTSEGAIANTGISQVTGDVGTFAGAISTFGNINGTKYTTTATTAAVADLTVVAADLDAAVVTKNIGPLLGSGKRLYAGVYYINQAASLTECIILDAENDPDAIFIIKIDGRFDTYALSEVNLINGALACNVFWYVKGAVGMAAGTSMKGNVIGTGAIDIGAGSELEGRAFSTKGALSIYTTYAHLPLGCGNPTLTGPAFPALGSTADFGIFTSAGAVIDYGGLSVVNGDIGTQVGAVTGFTPSNITGTNHLTPNTTTATCETDLQALITYLSDLPHDIELEFPASLGNSLVLTPHTYLMAAPAALTDTLFLNGQGNPNAIFVIKILGALTTSTYAQVKLINQAQSKNVFWLINGAFTLSGYSDFRGTYICNVGAISIANYARVDGGLLSKAGDISMTADSISTLNLTSLDVVETIINCPINPLSVESLSFNAELSSSNDVLLKWITTSETNNDYFMVERSSNLTDWEEVTKVDGGGNSASTISYSTIDSHPLFGESYYRLNVVDEYGIHTYSNIEAINSSKMNLQPSVYPNPFKRSTRIEASEAEIENLRIFNLLGQDITSQIEFIKENKTVVFLDFNDVNPGTYFINSATTNTKVIKE